MNILKITTQHSRLVVWLGSLEQRPVRRQRPSAYTQPSSLPSTWAELVTEAQLLADEYGGTLEEVMDALKAIYGFFSPFYELPQPPSPA